MDDVEKLVRDYNYIKEKTGATDEMARDLLYQLNMQREARSRLPIEWAEWPNTN